MDDKGKKKSIFFNVDRSSLSNALKNKRPLSQNINVASNKQNISNSLPVGKVRFLKENTENHILQKTTEKKEILFDMKSKKTILRKPRKGKKKVSQIIASEKNIANTKVNSFHQKKNDAITKKYQDHRLYDIKKHTVPNHGEKYQDHRLHDIKKHSVPNHGEKYQDHRLHDIKKHTAPNHGEKYQDHRLHDIKKHIVKNNGKKYQDHRLV